MVKRICAQVLRFNDPPRSFSPESRSIPFPIYFILFYFSFEGGRLVEIQLTVFPSAAIVSSHCCPLPGNVGNSCRIHPVNGAKELSDICTFRSYK